MALKAESVEFQRQIDAHQTYIRKVFENQNRLRENIKSLDKMVESDLMKRYLKDLNHEEDDLIRTTKKSDTIAAQKIECDKKVTELQFTLTKSARVVREELGQD